MKIHEEWRCMNAWHWVPIHPSIWKVHGLGTKYPIHHRIFSLSSMVNGNPCTWYYEHQNYTIVIILGSTPSDCVPAPISRSDVRRLLTGNSMPPSPSPPTTDHFNCHKIIIHTNRRGPVSPVCHVSSGSRTRGGFCGSVSNRKSGWCPGSVLNIYFFLSLSNW